MASARQPERRPAVCVVGHKYYPDHNHVRRDVQALVATGYDVSLVGLRQVGQPLVERCDGATIYRLPVEHRRGGPARYVLEYILFLILAFLTVGYLHLRKRFGVVEVINMPDALVVCSLVPKLLGARVILYIFDNMPELLMSTGGRSADDPRVRLLALQERLSARYADQIIVTQEIARRVVAGRGVPADKISVVLNGPDEQVFGLRQPRQREPGGTFRIVTHGTILERFGIQHLIQALPALASQIPSLQLEIIGEGEYRPKLQALVERTGVGHLVSFQGWMPPRELIPRLERADLGYVGMLCDLMLSNKLMEYAALGIPAVVARWSTYEFYFPDEAVAYFPPADVEALVEAIVHLYREPEQAYHQALAAFELYERYRWARQRQAYLGVYRRLLAPPTSGQIAPASTGS